jgi:hypothetical protein
VGGDIYRSTNPREFDPATSVYLNSAAFACRLRSNWGIPQECWIGYAAFREKRIALAVKRIPITEKVRAWFGRMRRILQSGPLEQSDHEHYQFQLWQSHGAAGGRNISSMPQLSLMWPR